MRPDIDVFREAVKKYRGNLTKVAEAFGVERATVENWKNSSPEFKRVVRDARMRLYDDCLISGELLAKGIVEKDDKGNPIGWIEKPDSQMVRYFISMLGKDDGFSDTPETAQDKPLEATFKDISINVVYNDKKDLELQGKRQEVEDENKAE